jgi:hypothetical protein
VRRLREEIRKVLGDAPGGSPDGGGAPKPRPGHGPLAMVMMSLESLAGVKAAAALAPERLAELKPERLTKLRPLLRTVRDRCQAALDATRRGGGGA